MAKLEAYTSLEDTVSSVLFKEWSVVAKEAVAKLIPAIEGRKWNEAYAIADKLTMNGVVEARRSKMVEMGVSALIFGGGQLVPLKDTKIARTKEIPDILERAIDQLTVMVEENGTDAVTRALRAFIASQEEAANDEAYEVKKAAIPKDELADKLNAVVMGTGKGFTDVGANLTTSRLVSYGMLAEAVEQKVSTYQISEVLDQNTCAICQYMHGKTFAVASEYSRLDQILRIMDPNELKLAAPWPSQTKAAVAQFKSLTEAELQDRGYGSPPFHPLCRGILVSAGTITITLPPTAPAINALGTLQVAQTTYTELQSAADFKGLADQMKPTLPFTMKEKSSLLSYADTPETISGKLRSGSVLENAEQEVVQALDTAMAKSSMPYDIVLFRGVSSSVNFIESEVFLDPSFMVTSTNRAKASKFAKGTLMVINVRGGTRAVNMLNVIADDPGNTVVLNRGGNYRVVSVKEEDGLKTVVLESI